MCIKGGNVRWEMHVNVLVMMKNESWKIKGKTGKALRAHGKGVFGGVNACECMAFEMIVVWK
ncbi:S ribonuclease [Pyrus ussuriensis x Pyrus communis]|uniref:S ribonuclease n=1 Tax=Pyrus ussuriensis x Pyrus communis TaxID=2448454 RepID=A0A5N5FP15_9ROSA|nr:S ribonuclease [Pyrus ussuriensis x Pyrus communis]KAB2604617.1 S ribonuclease [Pyrus ussuriensis x Pyrus communis]KAB2611187.1 S ribonuclease [Pyrus ussuriensis x Pyrus communis]KAB2635727.1 S ribonuclease [Pyrus ussuriensis x Pyrus communis]KAB2635728.1 S ribonuclease [Pyrus ussuriensis x Pyrus communis]